MSGSSGSFGPHDFSEFPPKAHAPTLRVANIDRAPLCRGSGETGVVAFTASLLVSEHPSQSGDSDWKSFENRGYEFDLGPTRAGGNGEVRKARCMSLNRWVALKRLFADPGVAREAVERALQLEASLLASASAHPNVVQVFRLWHRSLGDSVERVYVEMEYLGGGTLLDWLVLQPRTALEIVRSMLPVLSALQHLHERNISHRDVKPSNILRCEVMNQFKLADFGLSRLIASGSTSTGFESVTGTPGYVDPLDFREGPKSDKRSDLYQFAATLFTALSKRTPQDPETQRRAMSGGRVEQPLAPGQACSDPGLSNLLAAALSLDVSLRPRDAAALIDQLRTWEARTAAEGSLTQEHFVQRSHGGLVLRNPLDPSGGKLVFLTERKWEEFKTRRAYAWTPEARTRFWLGETALTPFDQSRAERACLNAQQFVDAVRGRWRGTPGVLEDEASGAKLTEEWQRTSRKHYGLPETGSWPPAASSSRWASWMSATHRVHVSKAQDMNAGLLVATVWPMRFLPGETPHEDELFSKHVEALRELAKVTTPHGGALGLVLGVIGRVGSGVSTRNAPGVLERVLMCVPDATTNGVWREAPLELLDLAANQLADMLEPTSPADVMNLLLKYADPLLKSGDPCHLDLASTTLGQQRHRMLVAARGLVASGKVRWLKVDVAIGRADI